MSENEPKVQDLLLGGWECPAAACPAWDEPQRAEELQGPPEKPGDPSGGVGGEPPPQRPLSTEPSPLPPGTARGGSWIPVPAAPVVLEVEEAVVEVPGEGGTEAPPRSPPARPAAMGPPHKAFPGTMRPQLEGAGLGQGYRKGRGWYRGHSPQSPGATPYRYRPHSPLTSGRAGPGSARWGLSPHPHLSTCRARDLKTPQNVDFGQ